MTVSDKTLGATGVRGCSMRPILSGEYENPGGLIYTKIGAMNVP